MAFPFIMSGFLPAAKALKVNDGSLEKKLIFKAISGYISHKAACRRGIGNCPALIIFFFTLRSFLGKMEPVWFTRIPTMLCT